MRSTKGVIQNFIWIILITLACFLTVFFFFKIDHDGKTVFHVISFTGDLLFYIGAGLIFIHSRKNAFYVIGFFFLLTSLIIFVPSLIGGPTVYKGLRAIVSLYCLYAAAWKLFSNGFEPVVRIAVLLRPNSTIVAYRMSYILMIKQKYDKASELAKKVLEMDNAFDAARYVLGISLYYLNDFSKARIELDKITLDLMREEVQGAILHFLGLIDFEMEFYESAVSYFDSAIKIEGNNEELLFCQAICFEELKNYDRALENYSRLIELNKEAGFVFYNRGKLYEKLGKTELAEADLKKSVQAGQPDLKGFIALGSLELERGNMEKAGEYYQEGVKRDHSLGEYLPPDMKDRIKED